MHRLVRTAIVQRSVEMGGETCADRKGQRKMDGYGRQGNRWKWIGRRAGGREPAQECARKRMKMGGSHGRAWVRGRVRPVRAQWVKIGGEKGPVDMSERGETVGMCVHGSEWFCVSYK